MPFLAPLVPALIGSVISAGASAAVDAAGKAISGSGKQAQPGQTPLGSVNFKSADVGQVGFNQANLAQPVTGDLGAQAIDTANQGLSQQQQLAQQLSAQGGIQNQSNVYAQQQGLANQLGALAQGQGPNPALAQLAIGTGNNIAQQGALMAGQRGAGANAGLIARQAAQQGGAIQQGALGQAAALQSQQQLNAIGALQQQQGMLGNLATQQVGQQSGAIGGVNQYAQGQQGQLLNALQGQNAQNLQQTQGLNQLNLQQQQGVNSLNAQQQQNINQLNLQQQQGLNNANLNQQQGVNTINASNAQATNQNIQQGTKGLAGGIGSAITSGVTKAFAEGGQVPNLKESYKGKSKIGGHLAQNFKAGGKVPGKPAVPGAKDSYANDTVPAKLSPGEWVIPRSVTQSANPRAEAMKFIDTLIAKKGKK